MRDTDANAQIVQLRAMRAMPPERRLALAAGWSTSLRAMILAALKQEYPGASASHLRFLLAERCYGRETASRAYGDELAHE